MNIFVLAHEPYLNGASQSLLTMLIGLKDKHNFLVIIPDKGAMEDALIANKINYQIIDIPRCGYFNFVSLSDHYKKSRNYYKSKGYFITQLIELSKVFQPDIIYSNTSIISLGYDLSKKIRKPHIWHIREYGDKDFNISYIPYRRNIIRKITRSTLSVFTTHLLKEHWIKSIGLNARVVYNGFFEKGIAKKNKLRNDTFKIGIVGVVMEAKGQLEALSILNQVQIKKSKVELYIYGHLSDQEYYNQLQAFISKNSLEQKVSFKYYVPNNIIYSEIDFLLSCAKSEAFGRTIIEAMSYAIPVISRKSGGPVELIEDNIDGFLYEAQEEAAQKIIELMDHPEIYSVVGNKACIAASTKFSKEEYLRNMNLIFTDALTPNKIL